MRPSGLILDFGGVISLSEKTSDWSIKVAEEIRQLGVGLPRERIAGDLTAADTAYSLWRDAMSRPMSPPEIEHEQYVLDFVAADWPEPDRAALTDHAADICRSIAEQQVNRTVRPGIVQLLDWCAEVGLPAAVASNALVGDVHRAFLAHHGLDRLFVAQVYSDEAGVRKPNPQLITLAAEAMGLSTSDCWYVGDRVDRDVLCGHRAGIAKTILTPVPGASPRPFAVPVAPRYMLANPLHLIAILEGL